ncbi:MAG: DUF7670 domain-containing protein [bacterium JZ-2024 1]
MKLTISGNFVWIPRILSILFAGFLGLFALDVFKESTSFWETTGAFLVHLIPAYLVLIALYIAWRRERWGFIVFVALAVLYAVWAWAWGRFNWTALLVISGTLVMIALLFLLASTYPARGNLDADRGK